MRRQLYGEDDDRSFFDSIRQELKATDKKLEEGRAVLHHLEMYLVNVACDDPGASIGANLVLPLLQERLDAHAQEFAAQKSAAAQEAIIRMEARTVFTHTAALTYALTSACLHFLTPSVSLSDD